MSRRKAKYEIQKDNYEALFPGDAKNVGNNATENRRYVNIGMYYHLLKQLAVSRFSWQGLPPGIDERFIELRLFENGGMPLIFFYDRIRLRYMVTECSNMGFQNTYLNPTSYTPYGVDYSYRKLQPDECVPIWDNMLRTPLHDVMYLYATRLAAIDRAFDVNIDNSVWPQIVVTTETQKLTIENLLKQKNDGAPIVIAYDNLDNINQVVQNIPNSGEYIADKLLNAKAQVWNEAISFLGISNSNTEKKERLISDEVEAGAEKTDVFRLAFLKTRQQACDQINNMFGGDGIIVGVDWSDNTTDATIGGDNGD